MTAPLNPCTQVDNEAQPKLTTKSGIANGTTTRTAQIWRPGRSVRSTHQAVECADDRREQGHDNGISRTVFHSRVAVSGLQMRWETLSRLRRREPRSLRRRRERGGPARPLPLVPRDRKGYGSCEPGRSRLGSVVSGVGQCRGHRADAWSWTRVLAYRARAGIGSSASQKPDLLQ